MNAEEMKLKCMAIAGEIADLYDPEDYETPEESDMARAANRACLSVVNSIAVLQVEPDPRAAQIAALREALKEARRFVDYFAEDRRTFVGSGTPKSCVAEIDAALSATEPKGEGK